MADFDSTASNDPIANIVAILRAFLGDGILAFDPYALLGIASTTSVAALGTRLDELSARVEQVARQRSQRELDALLARVGELRTVVARSADTDRAADDRAGTDPREARPRPVRAAVATATAGSRRADIRVVSTEPEPSLSSGAAPPVALVPRAADKREAVRALAEKIGALETGLRRLAEASAEREARRET